MSSGDLLIQMLSHVLILPVCKFMHRDTRNHSGSG